MNAHTEILGSAKILMVDDHHDNLKVLEGILRKSGYRHLQELSDSSQFFARYEEYQPDLILLDLHMPKPNGFELLEQLSARLPAQSYLPILVLTADITPGARVKAIALGATDFLTKPIDRVDLLMRTRNLLYARWMHRRLQEAEWAAKQNPATELSHWSRVAAETEEEFLQCLARTATYREDRTGLRAQRVSFLAGLIARKMQWAPEQVAQIERASLLHDIGKTGIEDTILRKTPGSLTPLETEVLKQHTTIGAGLLSGARAPLLELAREIALTHHERWDGSGYPNGLSGPVIPLTGRIVAVAEAFADLTHERPPLPTLSEQDAVRQIQTLAGRAYDPDIVRAMAEAIMPPHSRPVEQLTLASR